MKKIVDLPTEVVKKLRVLAAKTPLSVKGYIEKIVIDHTKTN